MTFLKETLLSGERQVSSGFVFTKTHAIVIASVVLLFFMASYFFQTWGSTFLKSYLQQEDTHDDELMDTNMYEEGDTNMYEEGEEEELLPGHSAPILPFSKSPPRAQECMNDSTGRFYSMEEGGHCTDQCPAPTFPDEEGHCRTGLSSS